MAHGLSGLPEGVTLKPLSPGDHDFLLQLYASTREEELALVPWTDAEKAAFVEQQFEAQSSSYRDAWPKGDFLVVLVDGDRAGRLYLARLPRELRVVDVLLSPAYRGRGIGTALLAAVVRVAEREGVDVTLHVEPWNPAKRLYERLGFLSVEATGIYELMRRSAYVNVAS